MKGKSPWNKLSIKKTDVYRLLLDLGGEARWRDLKANLKKLGWGPTTLKQTLDEMVEEGSIIKEARLGPKGPEAWYAVVIKDDEIWGPLLKSISREMPVSTEAIEVKEEKYVTAEELVQLVNEIKDTSIEQVGQKIREKADQLKGAERKVFLKGQTRKIMQLALEELQASIYMEVRGVWKISREKISFYHPMLRAMFNQHLEEYLKVLIDYPEYTMEVLLDQMFKDEDKREEAMREEGLKK